MVWLRQRRALNKVTPSEPGIEEPSTRGVGGSFRISTHLAIIFFSLYIGRSELFRKLTFLVLGADAFLCPYVSSPTPKQWRDPSYNREAWQPRAMDGLCAADAGWCQCDGPVSGAA